MYYDPRRNNYIISNNSELIENFDDDTPNVPTSTSVGPGGTEVCTNPAKKVGDVFCCSSNTPPTPPTPTSTHTSTSTSCHKVLSPCAQGPITECKPYMKNKIVRYNPNNGRKAKKGKKPPPCDCTSTGTASSSAVEPDLPTFDIFPASCTINNLYGTYPKADGLGSWSTDLSNSDSSSTSADGGDTSTESFSNRFIENFDDSGTGTSNNDPNNAQDSFPQKIDPQGGDVGTPIDKPDGPMDHALTERQGESIRPGALCGLLNPAMPNKYIKGKTPLDDATEKAPWPGYGQHIISQSDRHNDKHGEHDYPGGIRDFMQDYPPEDQGDCKSCNWTWSAGCLPTCANYYDIHNDQQRLKGNTTLTDSGYHIINAKKHYPIPDTCRKDFESNSIKASPDQPAIFYNDATKKHFIYVDGRLMALKDDWDTSGCKMASMWLDPNCSPGSGNCQPVNDLKNITKNPLSDACYSKLPLLSGNGKSWDAKGDGKSMVNELECNGDIRPREKVFISNEIVKEANRWSDIGRKNSFLYNTKSAVAASKYGEIEKSNIILRKQVDNSQSNNDKMKRLNSSILSTQRQVQIANDDTRRRNENLFLLKLLLTYCLVIAIPFGLKIPLRNSFKDNHIALIFIFITIPFAYILIKNLYAIRNRSAIRWPLRNWPTGPIPGDNPTTEEEGPPLCPPPNQCSLIAEEEMRELEEEIQSLRDDEKEKEKEIAKDDKEVSKLEQKLCKLYNKCPKKWHGIPLRGCVGGSITI